MTTLLSLLLHVGDVAVLFNVDDDVDDDDAVAAGDDGDAVTVATAVDATDDDVVNEIDTVDDDGFSSFETFSTSDLMTANEDSLMLISFTAEVLLCASILFELLGCSSPRDEDDRIDFPQAVTEKYVIFFI